MSAKNCMLTARDFAVVERLLHQRGKHSEGLLALLHSKLEGSLVVRDSDLPSTVARLDSRVAFRIDGGVSETRIIVRNPSVVGLCLPVTSLTGLALLGLEEGQDCSFRHSPLGTPAVVSLEKVVYQPALAARADPDLRAQADLPRPAPFLRLVASNDRRVAWRRSGGEGPSAA